MIPTTNNQLLVSEDWKKIYQSFRTADFKSYDFETLRRTMISYLQENYPEEFNDFIDSSEYIALIDLIAYLGQNLSFRIDLNARENFLETAERRDSILRLAQLISYNPARNIPASGFLKVTAISTSDNVYDSNGTNLANTTISWNDPTNPDWYQQFINIVNSALTSNFGNPSDKDTISGIATEQYRVNSSNDDVAVFSFSKNINGVPMTFEVVPSTFAGETFIYEEAPAPANAFSLIYKNDNQGSGSANTGFFTMFKQGTLSLAQFSLDNPVPNEIVGVNTPNINNTDVWLWQLDRNGNFSTLWSQAPNLVGNNVIYNSLNKNLRNVYAVTTRSDDQIDLNFADGVFGDLPKGEFRLFYRQSNGLTYVIKPEQMSGVTIVIPYVNASGQSHQLQLTMSLQYTVSNSSGAESNASIQLKAPQTYYTQNRMITAEDYNISPLTAGPDILKVKSTNRISSGISRYFDISDVSGRYSSTNIFSDDGILYKEPIEEYFDFEFSNRNQVLSVIKNSIAPIVADTSLKMFYYNNYARPLLSSLNLVWVEVTKTSGQSTGYFKNSNGAQFVGLYSQNNLQYVTSGSLVKFVAPVGKYFDDNNNIKTIPSSNILPPGGKTFIWSSVSQVVGDGANSGLGELSNGTGPVILGVRIAGDGTANNSAIPVEVLPKYSSLLPYSIENEIANICMSQRNFGLTIDSSTRDWSIILNSNLNVVDSFNLDTQNDITDSGKDASWIIAFVWNGNNYRVRYRKLNFVFESAGKTAFFIDESSINYDFINNSVIKDKIEVLSINPEPFNVNGTTWSNGTTDPTSVNTTSFYINTSTNKIFKNISKTQTVGVWVESFNMSGQLGLDYTWQIDDSIIETDGYINPKKVKVSFYDYNNTGQIDNPDVFSEIVGSGNYIYFKRSTDALTYSLTTDVIHELESESDWISYKFSLDTSARPVQDGDLVYFYSPNENVIKYWSASLGGNGLVYTDSYFAKEGRSGLKFHYIHNTGDDKRIDPSKTNLIDIYVLTLSYDTEYRAWLTGNGSTEPLPPTYQSLEQNYKDKLEPIKAISDEIVFHPVKYKVLFGNSANSNLQAVFKAVRNPNYPTTDNDIKSRILTAINEFFALENWEFGQSFYFSELSAYIMNKLTPDITNFVIVPKNNFSFGSLYEISSQPDEIFISGASINDIEVIDNITASQLKISSTIVTTSGT